VNNVALKKQTVSCPYLQNGIDRNGVMKKADLDEDGLVQVRQTLHFHGNHCPLVRG
jgi:hypothetical protein